MVIYLDNGDSHLGTMTNFLGCGVGGSCTDCNMSVFSRYFWSRCAVI